MPEEARENSKPYHIVDLNYVSLYIEDFQEALEFYGKVFGPPENADDENKIYGWRMGASWLTVFPSKIGTHPGSNARNVEFAIQLSSLEEVDTLYDALIEAGAKSCWEPEDTQMYEDMRFSCVDDPFGVRIDVYCPIEKKAG